MTVKKQSFIQLIQIWGAVFLIGMGTAIIAIDVINSYRSANFRANQMRKDYVTHQKQIVKQEVKRVVDLITYEKAQAEKLTRKMIKSRVSEAYAIASNLYRKYRASRTDSEIQTLIIQALRPIRYQHDSGYYFITRTDGFEVLFADKPEMEGRNLLDVKDVQGKYVIRDMIEIVNQSGEGFYEYLWTKPDIKGNNFRKISYIKRFEPFNWFIGTGLYVIDVEEQIENNLLSTISRIRFGKNGYIFINRLNGDALVSNGKRLPSDQKLWEIFNHDAGKTKAIFKKEYQAALKPEGDFIYYSWEKLSGSSEESPKTSFIIGIPDLQWLVGAGVYLDEIEADIASMQTDLNNQINIKLRYFSLFVMGIVLFFLLFLNRLSQRLKNDLDLFLSFFTKAAYTDEKIDLAKVKFIELGQMAASANKMISDRKKTETALRESEEEYRNLFENTYDIYYRSDHKGIFTLLSPSVERYTGYTADELIGQHIKKLYIYPEVIEEFLSLLTKNGRVDNFENQIRCKDNSTRWLSVNSKILTDQEGNFIGVEGIARDVSELKRVENEKLLVETRLQQSHKMEAIGTLAGGIAHDFNNVLFSIIGYTELTLDDVPEGSLAHKNLTEVFNGAMRATEMVKQILAFSRNSITEKKPIKIQSAVQEALNLLKTSIPSTIEIRQNIDEICRPATENSAKAGHQIENSCRPVLADATQIHQVVMNLATNAYHAMTDKGGVLGLTLKQVEVGPDDPDLALAPGAYAKLTVSDTGHGIDQQIISKIFDPYFSTKAPGKGTGMGLSVVHGIVKDHGGDIKVSSKIGEGTVFEVYFPLIGTDPVENEEAIPTDFPSTGTEHILVVDDEEPLVSMARQILERLGYRVTSRTSSIEALEAFKAKPDEYDIVITDMTMPNLTGAGLAIKLKRIRPDVPIVLCTGFSEKIDKKKAKSMGISGYIMKPILKSELSRILRKLLD